jgi:predicted nucleic acid-binding protein
MHFFADACFLIAMHDKTDNEHNEACDIWNKLFKNKMIKGYNNLFMSDYILIEVFHRLQKKISFIETLNCYDKITENCNIVKVAYPETIKNAIELKLRPFCSHKTKKPKIGLTDATSLVIMEEKNINYIISFDDHFENIPFIFRIYNADQLNNFS